MKFEFRWPMLYIAVGSVSHTRLCVAGIVNIYIWLNSVTVIIGTTVCLLPINMDLYILPSTGNVTPFVTCKCAVRLFVHVFRKEL